MKKNQLNIVYIILGIAVIAALIYYFVGRNKQVVIVSSTPSIAPVAGLPLRPATVSEPFFYGDDEYFRYSRRYINLADARAKLSGYIDKLFEYITTFKLILKNVGIDLCSLVGQGSDSIMDYIEDNFPDKLALLVEKIRGIPYIGNKLADIAGNQVDTISAFLAGAVVDLVEKYGDKLKTKLRCK